MPSLRRVCRRRHFVPRRPIKRSQHMTSNITASVAIADGGPIGLTLAMDLARRGVDVVVIEQRRACEAPSVKCNHVSSRTMEIFRRLGLAAEIRSAGLPDDYPNDVAV